MAKKEIKKTKNLNLTESVNKVDRFSKLSLLLIFITLVIILVNFFNKERSVSPVEKKMRALSSYKLNVIDYAFGNGFKERLLIDDVLIIKLGTPIQKDFFDKLTFEINPSDTIVPEFIDERTININFKNKMKLNNDTYTIHILFNNEIVYTLSFNNTTYDEKFFQNLNRGRVSSE